jgi:DNA-binding transcriptional ArsR family regulator
MKEHAAWDEVDLSAVGSLLADPARSAILIALMGGISLPPSELAARAGVSASTATFHLAKLMAAGWVVAERCGRHRYYRLASAEVAELIEDLARHIPPARVTSLRAFRARDELRFARSCYSHLAGLLGVTVTGAFLEQGFIRLAEGTFVLTLLGRDTLTRRGVELPASRVSGRKLARPCVDWTERRSHLAGALGTALLDHLLDVNALERGPAKRSLRLTRTGHDLLDEWAIPRPPADQATA